MKKKRAEKQAVKTVKAKKSIEKIEKPDIPTPKEEIIENDQSMLPEKNLFRIDEVAAYFSITERTVRLWIEHGHLTAVKKGGIIRIPRASILDCHILDNREIL